MHRRLFSCDIDDLRAKAGREVDLGGCSESCDNYVRFGQGVKQELVQMQLDLGVPTLPQLITTL